MRKLLVLCFLAACSGRPLDVPCTKSTDCDPVDWCVQTWGVQREPAGVCASQCATNADCASGDCQRIGDGTTTAWPVEPFACRE